MLKRTLAAALSAAFFMMAPTIAIAPLDQAHAEMATKSETATKSKSKPGTSFSERRKKCGAEWKEAKAAGKTSNMKWPQFWSDCNKRLKTSG
jgi:hypothetical protein